MAIGTGQRLEGPVVRLGFLITLARRSASYGALTPARLTAPAVGSWESRRPEAAWGRVPYTAPSNRIRTSPLNVATVVFASGGQRAFSWREADRSRGNRVGTLLRRGVAVGCAITCLCVGLVAFVGSTQPKELRSLHWTPFHALRPMSALRWVRMARLARW